MSNDSTQRHANYSPKALFLIAGAALLLVIAREPKFLLEPRIWGEEGTIYIQQFLSNGWLSGLFSPALGYYSLVANFSAVFSVALVGLQWAAFVTTAISLTLYLICILAPLFLRSVYWSGLGARATLIAFTIIVSSPEIWLNTINVHFYLGLFACYVLLSDTEQLSPRLFIFVSLVLAVGALTSGTTVILAPLFIAKFLYAKRQGWCERAVQRNFLQAVILSLGLGIQVLAKIFSVDDELPRLSIDYFQYLPLGLMRTFFYGFSENPNTISMVFSVLTAVAACSAFVVLKRARAVLLLALYVGVVYTLLSLGMMGGGRYAFIPTVLLVLYGVNLFANLPWPLARYTLVAAGAAFFIYRTPLYFDTQRFYQDDWLSFSEEYARALESGESEVRVFPQWQEIDWRISLPEQSASK
ncbi:MAG: hypothetical protein R3332_11675 [Pseudohongiellaceae bacterium]|nr:hypothetical protein [Pseudohongiellaceae bacterium]